MTKGHTNQHYWSQHVGTPEVNTWYGLAYERICKAHIPQIKRALGIASVATEYYSWRSRKSKDAAQIDIIIDRADSMINLCEVKYSEALYTLDKDEYLRIMHRRDAFRAETETHKSIIPTMITTFGMTQGAYSDQMTVKLDMNELFDND